MGMTAKKTKSTAGDSIQDNAATPDAMATTSAATTNSAAKPAKAKKIVKLSKKSKEASAKTAAVATTAAKKKKASPKKTAPPKSGGKQTEPKAVKPVTKPKAPKEKTEKISAGKKGDKQETAKILDSQVAFEGPLFRVLRDHIIEPGGRESHRDVIRHNGSVVILATDQGKKKKDPWVVIERQYRHAAGQFLWELPAGKLDAGEAPIDGAKRELAEETGYQAKKWSELVVYFASPGFLGESMKVFLAEGLVAGDAHPEEDEHIDFRLVKLSELLEMVDKGKIVDGKTLTSVLLYARQLGIKRKG
jgi:ADP-ribose pyrophosphatase